LSGNDLSGLKSLTLGGSGLSNLNLILSLNLPQLATLNIPSNNLT
jgi:hypothetical protein